MRASEMRLQSGGAVHDRSRRAEAGRCGQVRRWREGEGDGGVRTGDGMVEVAPLEPVELRRERERGEIDGDGAGDRVRRVEVERDERDERVAADRAREIDVRQDAERELE